MLLESQLNVLGCTVQQLEQHVLHVQLKRMPQGNGGGGGEAVMLATGDVGVSGSMLDELTDDVLAQVLAHYLSPLEVCLVARTCRMLRGLCNFGSKSGKIWQGVCARLWPRQADMLCGRGIDMDWPHEWRALCLESCFLDQRWEEGLQKSTVSVIKCDAASPVFNVCLRQNTIVSAEDACVRVIDFARKCTRRTLHCSPHGHRMVLGVWLDDAAETCLSGAADGDIKVWDVKTGACKRVMPGHQGAVVSLKAHERLIVSSSFDATARVWDWQGRQQLVLTGHRGHVCGLWLSDVAEGGHVAWTGADDGFVKKWHLTSGACEMELVQQVDSTATPSIWAVQVLFVFLGMPYTVPIPYRASGLGHPV